MGVGGGFGVLLASVLKANPPLRGILFEAPPVVEGAKKYIDVNAEHFKSGGGGSVWFFETFNFINLSPGLVISNRASNTEKKPHNQRGVKQHREKRFVKVA